MTRRVYTTFQVEDLRGMSYEHVATLMNARTSVNEEIRCFRNAYGDVFELRFDDGHVHVWAISGGVSLGEVDASSTNVGEILDDVEAKTRSWSEGYVPCAGCGQALRRFSADIVLAWHGGRYGACCAERYAPLAAKEVD